ncbi:AraC-type DNA-binding protein [Ferrimonas sediminum]|uniref:AraC-type DNA-binding protein n=1 Tax=Ferrimonas sediminum TaxID=718193 RepID=A0A1G8S9F8_9GAMM|nr:AraC family transcriptional regulator [Ferrimonas sediminum]SDJ25868.1 AraC-type DNA-binding protein [Ferrimonas sediminum]
MNRVSYHKTSIEDVSLIDAHYRRFAFERHFHLDYHLGLITEGEQRYYCRGSWHHAGPGQLVIMPPGETHDGQPEADQGYRVKVFALGAGWLRQQTGAEDHHRNTLACQQITDPGLYAQLSQCHHWLRQPELAQLAEDCLPLEAIGLLLARHGGRSVDCHTPLGRRQLFEIRDYLMAHLDQRIRLEDLSRLCQLSPSQLLRQFKALTGMTPYAWLARLRLEQGMALLRQGLPIAEVALQVGYYDQSHFTKAFKRQFLVAPSQLFATRH